MKRTVTNLVQWMAFVPLMVVSVLGFVRLSRRIEAVNSETARPVSMG